MKSAKVGFSRNVLPEVTDLSYNRWLLRRARRSLHDGKGAPLRSRCCALTTIPFPPLSPTRTPRCRPRSRSNPAQVFSAPNYVDQAGNKGAFVRNPRATFPRVYMALMNLLFISSLCVFDGLYSQIRIDAEGTQKYTQFEAQPHPPMKPMAYASSGLANLLM